MSRWTWVVAGVLLLGGCSGDPEPRFEAEPSPSVSVSATPSESVGPAAETPEDFIRRWARLDVEMQNSGNSTAYRAATVGCKTCKKLADRVDSIYADGGGIDFGGQEVTGIVLFASNETTAKYDVDVVTQPTRYSRSGDAEVESLPGGPTRYRVTLERSDGRWSMTDYVEVPL